MTDQPASEAMRRGLALWRGERYGEAAGAFRAACCRSPRDAAARRWLAAALWGAGRRGEALEALAEGLVFAPDDSALWRDLAAALRQDGQDSAAALAAAEAAGEMPTLDPGADLRELGAAAFGALRRAAPQTADDARRIIGGLGRLAPETAFDRLAVLMRDSHPERRAALMPVVCRLWERLPEQYGALLRFAVADEAAEVRTALREAVSERLAPPAGGPLRERLLADADPRLRGLALESLITAGDIEALRERYIGAGPTEQESLLEAFARLGATDDLAVGLYESLPGLRVAAARHLAATGAPEAGRLLAERLEIESDPEVRAVIDGALSALPQNPEPEAGVEVLTWTEENADES